MKTKILLLFFLASYFYNNTFAQFENKLFVEIHSLRIGDDIDARIFDAYAQNITLLPGFEVGYGFLEKWNLKIRFRNNGMDDIMNAKIAPIREIEGAFGLEYTRKFENKFYVSYEFGIFYERIKTELSNCYIPSNRSIELNVRHEKIFKGYGFGLNFNYRINPKFVVVLSSRYRWGSIKLNTSKKVILPEARCFNHRGSQESFELISKLGIRFTL